jgi:branched-chain amino acid transport system permease protein
MVGLDVIVQALLSDLFMGSVYALIAIGFTLVFGVTDIVNFANGHLVMAAMFATYLLFKVAGIDPYASLVLVLPLFFGIGVVVDLVVIQRIVEAPHSAHMTVTDVYAVCSSTSCSQQRSSLTTVSGVYIVP